jgi:hypothetical protein
MADEKRKKALRTSPAVETIIIYGVIKSVIDTYNEKNVKLSSKERK